MADPFTEDTARSLRKLWFDYLDTVEPIRPKLHAYCLRLTSSVWNAEDLVQDTLLRGFGAIGRADMSPGRAADGRGRRWFDHPHAYLAQIATNLWIDQQRRARLEMGSGANEADSAPPPEVITPAAGAALFARASPQERAAIVLKDVFDFSVEEVAGLLGATPGAVKAALHRGRAKLETARHTAPPRIRAASPELIDRFAAAFNRRDVAAVTALLLESTTFEALGVGGERGPKPIWLDASLRRDVTCERREVEGEWVAAFTFAQDGERRLAGLFRLEETEGRLARIINYYFCPDTLSVTAAELGVRAWSNGYHQSGETLAGMIANAQLPWAPGAAP